MEVSVRNWVLDCVLLSVDETVAVADDVAVEITV